MCPKWIFASEKVSGGKSGQILICLAERYGFIQSHCEGAGLVTGHADAAGSILAGCDDKGLDGVFDSDVDFLCGCKVEAD